MCKLGEKKKGCLKEKAEGEIGAPRRCGLQTLSIIFAVHLNKEGGDCLWTPGWFNAKPESERADQ